MTRSAWANTTAHELGHLLGLFHVDPDENSIDTLNREIMDYDATYFAEEGFINASTNMVKTFTPEEYYSKKHNPVYHLKRWVNGESHDDLIAGGTIPGEYDKRTWWDKIKIFLGLDVNESNTMLYDVHVLAGMSDCDDNLDVVSHFEQITLGELSEQEFFLGYYGLIDLLGASQPGGELDTVLAMGNPEDGTGVFIDSENGTVAATSWTVADAGYTELATCSVSHESVPEPSIFVLLAMGALGLLAVARRKQR